LTFRPSAGESGIVYGKTIVVRHCSRKQLSSGSVGGHCLLRNCFGFVCFLGGFGFWPSCGNSVLNQSLVGQLPSWFWLAPSCGSRGPARSFGLLIQSLVGPFPSWFWLGAEPQGQAVNNFFFVGQLPSWLWPRAVLREQGVNKLLLVRPPLWFWWGADLREQCEKQRLVDQLPSW
jgi:hypothetical protein